MFTYKQISQLNKTEMGIYQFIIQNMDDVLKMGVRELASKTFVSTATIVRFCQKVDCEGFLDFKTKLKAFQLNNYTTEADDIDALQDFFVYAKTEEFIDAIKTFVDYIQEAKTICFFGIGTSGVLGEFAARYFSNVGYFSQSISDPYYPPLVHDNESHLFIVLSECGETREVIDQVRLYQTKNSKILLITNKPDSTLDLMANASIYYYVKDIVLPQTYNISSQVPVIYIIERLTKELQKTKMRQIPLKTSTRND